MTSYGGGEPTDEELEAMRKREALRTLKDDYIPCPYCQGPSGLELLHAGSTLEHWCPDCDAMVPFG